MWSVTSRSVVGTTGEASLPAAHSEAGTASPVRLDPHQLSRLCSALTTSISLTC